MEEGLRVVDLTTGRSTPDSLPVGRRAHRVPGGPPGRADGQTLLIHVDPPLLQLPTGGLLGAERVRRVFEGLHARRLSRRAVPRERHSLICPCHQSQFNVLNGAQPSFGPAARPLPQLPIQLQSDGTFVGPR